MLYSMNLAKKETFHSDYLDEDLVDLLGGTFVIPESYQGDVVPVEPGYEGRMDLISLEVYGDDMYADILGRLNGPSNPLEVNEGLYMVLPGMAELDKFIQKPAEAWSEARQSANSKRPKAKTRNAKRKPNEAVVGDKRFNIDAQSKIVIY